MRSFGKICTLAVLGLGLAATAATAGEKEIPLNKVPKAVTDAFKARFPKATIKNAIEEEADGKISYELETTRPDGMSLDVVIKPNGEFVAVENQIKPSELPAPVVPAVEAKYPKAVISKAEAVESGNKSTSRWSSRRRTARRPRSSSTRPASSSRKRSDADGMARFAATIALTSQGAGR